MGKTGSARDAFAVLAKANQNTQEEKNERFLIRTRQNNVQTFDICDCMCMRKPGILVTLEKMRL